MIEFHDNGYSIHVPTWGNPAESWRNTFTSLCHVVRWVKQESICDDTFYAVIDLMEAMLPDDAALQQLHKQP